MSTAKRALEEIRIGTLADRTGTSPETIRYYERVGVLPRPARSGSGSYRRYDASDVERVGFIRRSRELGFSLDQVRDLLELGEHPDRPCAEVDRLARARLEEVEERLRQLEGLRDELTRVIRSCRGGRAIADCNILGSLGKVSGSKA